MILIADYGVGNIFSLQSSFKFIGEEAYLTKDADKLKQADKIILPGVGAFGDAAEKLRQSGLDTVVVEQAKQGKPLLGICLGMQLLFDRGLEYGEHAGLSILRGDVVPMRGYVHDGLKVPQIGWNALHIEKQGQLLKYCKENDYVYFVHSYHAMNCKDSVIATTEYDKPLTAAVEKENVFGCQFHPEKSGEVGLNILRAFCEAK